MKGLMEEWRAYQTRVESLQDYSHVTNVLGIDVPLSESGSIAYTPELREYVLAEQLLYEAFLDSMKTWVKKKVGEVPNLFKSVYKIMKNSETIGPFVELIEAKVIKPMLDNVKKVIEKIKRSSEGIAQKVMQTVDAAYTFLTKTSVSWKKVLLAITIAVLMRKLAWMLPNAAGTEGLEQAKSWFGSGALKKVVSDSTSFDKWLTFMTGAAGTVVYVAATIAPATEEFLKSVQEVVFKSEKVLDKEDGEYQASVVKPAKARMTREELETAIHDAVVLRLSEKSPCWDDYEQIGMKVKDGKEVPNCVPIDEEVLEEAEYQGKKVTLNDPIRTSGESKKFKVYVKNDKGNVVVVRFGDPDMEIRRDNPEARKNFRARHNCADKEDKTTAGYWSCWQWRAGSKVDN